jgi:dienelactone hydrolase
MCRVAVCSTPRPSVWARHWTEASRFVTEEPDMLTIEPADAVHDVALRVRNSDSVPRPLEVEWREASGRLLRADLMIFPGDFDLHEVGLFSKLEEVLPPSELVSVETQLAPIELSFSSGATAIRRTLPDGVTFEEVSERGIRAVLFKPPVGKQDLPPVVSLPGSGGGYRLTEAAALAGHGSLSLALAYCGLPGLPDGMVEIPIEYVVGGISLLAALAGVTPQEVVVMGRSRGAELALLTASLTTTGGVVAYVPSSQSHGELTKEGHKASWTWRGQPLASTPVDRSANHRTLSGRYTIRPGYEATIRDPAEADRTAIRVENISAPIFLVSGGDDQCWPSEVFASKIVDRARFNPNVTHLSFPQAGHMIDLPNQPRKPSPTAFFDDGGTPEADEEASRESWIKLLKWLGQLPSPTQRVGPSLDGR